MPFMQRFMRFVTVLHRRPNAIARISGSAQYPDINGTVRFFTTAQGVLVGAEVFGLPKSAGKCDSNIFAFHIHNGSRCSGNEEDPFANAMTHYNPDGCPHPTHAGDLPPLFANDGYAFLVFLTDRFSLREIIGKTVIIHSSVDDFTSQPAGKAGMKIACGEIKAF